MCPEATSEKLPLEMGLAVIFGLQYREVCAHTWKLHFHQWQSRVFLPVTNDCSDYPTSGAGLGVF